MKIPGQMMAAASPFLHPLRHSVIAAADSRRVAILQIAGQPATATDSALAAVILISSAEAVILVVMVTTGGLLLMRLLLPAHRRCRNLFRHQLIFQVN